MSTKHTPGPWTIESGGRIFSESADDMIFDLADYGHGEADEANARLIAAAPELLDACLEALKHLEHSGDCRLDPDPTYDSTGHIKMGRMPCPVCGLERATTKAKATGGDIPQELEVNRLARMGK